MTRPLPPELIETMEQAIERRARELASQVCAHCGRTLQQGEGLTPRQIELAATEYGLTPTGVPR